MCPAEPLLRPTLQRRSQATLERILLAGLEVLRERGFDGFTIGEVSERAGVSVGSIYRRVTGREALILAIYERATRWPEQEEDIRRNGARLDLAPRERIRLIVEGMTSAMLARGNVLRVFMRGAPVVPEIRQRAAEQSQGIAQAFADAVLARPGDVAHPDPEVAIDMAFRVAYCAVARRITHGARFESARLIPDEQFTRELSRVVASYLR